MTQELQGMRVAVLATDGVERVELDQPRGALQGAGAKTEIIGGLSVALAETFRNVYPDVKKPQTSHWDGVTAGFDRLL